MELEILEKAFNMLVNIPKSLAVNIPGLQGPSALLRLKKVRQKIKNKLKVAKVQLKCQHNISHSVKNNPKTMSNNISQASDYGIKNFNKSLKNSLDNNHVPLPEMYNPTTSNTNYSVESSMSIIKPKFHNSNIMTNSNITGYNDNSVANKTRHDEIKNNEMCVQPTSNSLVSSTIQSSVQKLVYTTPILNSDSEKVESLHHKSINASNVYSQNDSTSTQTMSRSK